MLHSNLQKTQSNFLPGPRGEAANGLLGMAVVGEGTCGTIVTPESGRLWTAGAAAASAGLLGELMGKDGVTMGDVAAVAAGMSYFCSCSR